MPPKPGSTDPRRRLGAQAHHLAVRLLRSSVTHSTSARLPVLRAGPRSGAPEHQFAQRESVDPGYAKATDLGNGRFLYPILGISGPLATWAALVVALITGATGSVVILLGIASGLAVLHTLATTQAAPTMLRIGRAENRVELIAPLLDRFTRLSWIRAALQVLTAAALLWLLVGQGELK